MTVLPHRYAALRSNVMLGIRRMQAGIGLNADLTFGAC
jgi:hypothetical protein